MVIFALAFVSAVVTIPLAGGEIRALDHFSIRCVRVLGLAAVAQIALAFLADGTVARVVNVTSLCLALSVILINLDRAGMTIAAVGALTNLAAIVSNFGVMPASPEAWAASGAPLLGAGFANARPIPQASLQFLGDWIPVPSWLPGAAPVSIGDLLLAAGLFVVIHAATAAPWTSRPRASGRLRTA